MSKLSDIRNKAIEKGMPLLSEDEVLTPKPLRWRTGPVPVDANGIGMEVYFELRDGRGHGLGTGEKKGGVWEGDWHLRKESILRWLPLSDILALVEEE